MTDDTDPKVTSLSEAKRKPRLVNDGSELPDMTKMPIGKIHPDHYNKISEKYNTTPNGYGEPRLRSFRYDYLPPEMQELMKPFHDLAVQIVETSVPYNDDFDGEEVDLNAETIAMLDTLMDVMNKYRNMVF